MQINHNIRAMVTQHALFQNNTSMSKSLEKLSTGLRINRAQDDAAGLAMSEQMRTQIRALGKSKQNSLDGQAALQIAEGGLAEITNLMQRQRELSIQSASDTLTSTERKYLDDEFQELTKEIKRISETTDYNGKNMLNFAEDPNASFGAVGQIASEAIIAQSMKDAFSKVNPANGEKSLQEMLEGYFHERLEGEYEKGRSKEAADAYNAMVRLAAILGADVDYDTPDNEDEPVVLVNDWEDGDDADIAAAGENITKAIDKALEKLKGLEALFMLDEEVFQEDDQETVKALHEGLSEEKSSHLSFMNLRNALYDLRDAASTKVGGVIQNYVKLDEQGNRLKPQMAASYTIHVGANYSRGIGGVNANEVAVTYLAVDVKSLKIERQSITSQWGAGEAIDQLDKVIKSISGARAKIGTYINRLDYTINNVANLEFNTQDAESRIRDTNFAFETTNFTRNQIMVQSATSMLAQANSLPQSVLSLIG